MVSQTQTRPAQCQPHNMPACWTQWNQLGQQAEPQLNRLQASHQLGRMDTMASALQEAIWQG